LVIDGGTISKPAAAFQRVVQRAVLPARELRRPLVTGVQGHRLAATGSKTRNRMASIVTSDRSATAARNLVVSNAAFITSQRLAGQGACCDAFGLRTHRV
jgi:hypothetical protein